MDMIEMLKDDHRRVRQDVQDCMQACQSGGQVNTDMLLRIQRMLLLHTKLEEEILYPRVKSEIPEEEELVQEFYDEHQQVRNILSNLVNREIDTDTCVTELRRLMEVVDEHVREEEEEMFPSVRQNISDKDYQEMSDQMTRMREQELQRQPI
jgi:hemerythrin superfamily protein